MQRLPLNRAAPLEEQERANSRVWRACVECRRKKVSPKRPFFWFGIAAEGHYSRRIAALEHGVNTSALKKKKKNNAWAAEAIIRT